MTKRQLKKLINNDITEIKIDEIRTLNRVQEVDIKNNIVFDYITLTFNHNLKNANYRDMYTIDFKIYEYTENDILSIIKKATNDFYARLIDYLNSSKVLPKKF